MLSDLPPPEARNGRGEVTDYPGKTGTRLHLAQADHPLVVPSSRRYGEEVRKTNLGTNVDQSIERRNSRRFQIALPLLLRWTDSGSHYDAGHCVNIGMGGMFVLAAKVPPVGMEVEVEFDLPAFGWVPRPTRLHCVGRVSRVETCCQLAGFAVAGHFVSELPDAHNACVPVNESSDIGISER